MTKKYRYEPFESFKEALEWVKQDRPIFKDGKKVDSPLYDTWTCELIDEWQSWKKAIEIEPEGSTEGEYLLNRYEAKEGMAFDVVFKNKEMPNSELYLPKGWLLTIKIEKPSDIDQDGNLVEGVGAN